MLMLFIVLLVLIALGTGSWGYSRYGMPGMTPAAIVLLLLLVLYLTGNLHLN